jgi:DNA adenine methylase
MAPGATDWATPGWLFDWLDGIFHFTLDAAAEAGNAKCARFHSREDDGLAQSWAGETVWLNPPFGAEIKGWMAKAAREHAEHGCTVVCLVPARTCTAWWHESVLPLARVVFFRGRIAFVRPDGTPGRPAPFSPALVIYSSAPVTELGAAIDLREVKREVDQGWHRERRKLTRVEKATAPTRPVLRWHGGKWRLAPWILNHFPPHRIYVEPYGGAASVLMRKPRSYAEIYNDLDGEVVNLFRVLQDEALAGRLTHLLRLTPFAREEFLLSYEPTDDPVERARRLVVVSFMGFGSNAHNRGIKTGFRANSNRSGTPPAHEWEHFPLALPGTVTRLQGVVIETRDALAVMAQHDGPKTLHYVDPPYMTETRSGKMHRKCNYSHEMDAADHERLLEFLNGLAGMVVLSAYPHPLYDGMLTGWQRIERAAFADGARPRTEVLWLNPLAAARRNTMTLFDQVNMGGDPFGMESVEELDIRKLQRLEMDASGGEL